MIATLGHELLLLMLNLSRMRDRGQILRLFVEALDAARPNVHVRRLAEGEACDGEPIVIDAPGAAPVRLALEDPDGALQEPERARYRNAARMLGVVLENVALTERLESENARLDAAVAARTAELTRALAESEDLYQNAPCGYHSLDARGVFRRVNDTELRWLGHARQELLGRRRFEELVAPDAREPFARAWSALLDTGAPQELELELVRASGARLPVVISAAAQRDASGALDELRFTLHDVSERRRAEQALREADARYRQSQKMEALGRLAGGVAHDFNNLLMVILGYGDDLAEAATIPDKLRREAADIVEAGQRAAQLTRQLLAFGRRHATRAEPLDVGLVVSGMEKRLRRLIGEDVELLIARGDTSRRVLADPSQLEQVVLNLVVNARDALEGRGGCIRVEVSEIALAADDPSWPEARAGAYVRLAVTDDGCGMSPEVLAHVFEPFFTTKPEGRGTGLGLATVYGNVKAAGGDLRIESTVGLGTRFEVLLPVAESEQRDSQEPASGPRSTRGHETILLVEDERNVRAVSAAALRAAGYVVLEAADGEAALAMTSDVGRLDALVTDVVMPRLSGVELAERLRRRSPELPVVFMSGYASEDFASRVGAGATPIVLGKPFTAVALTSAVREAIDAARAGGRAQRAGA
jgi:PAS domain S-box-containing protein